ncbi:MAG: phosphopyruvate hydratase, partial [Hadesarchaea archaeon]|nr:phosphopyruvate hydratase [Hadesarchaea archaeon]
MGELIIGNIKARKILDSRGNPTIEVETTIQNESSDTIGFGSAAAPSGASRGVHEVTPFSEGSVDKSIEELSEISEELKGTNFENQASFDEKCRELDGTPDLSKVGGNAIIALSMSIAKAVASTENSPLYRYLNPNNSLKLPYPLGNVLGGGEHAGPTSPDIQEFLVLPVGAESFQQAAFANAKVHGLVEEILTRENSEFAGGKSDE